MKIITLLFSAFFCISVLQAQKKSIETQKSSRIEKNINSQWVFNYIPEETTGKGYESPGFDDSKWPAISLPHTWNTFETTGELHPSIRKGEDSDNPYWWTGQGWYRKHFSVNRDYADRKVFIVFESVQKFYKVWLNGKVVADYKDGSGSCDFDITGIIKPGEDNVLAVAVNNQKDKLSISPVVEENFSAYGGICSDVTIVLKDKLYIPIQGSSCHEGGTHITVPQCSEKEGFVRVETWVKNDDLQNKTCILQTTITDASDKIVQVIKTEAVINPGQLYKFDQTSKSIKNPHLWSTEDPYLYKVYTWVLDGKQVVDTYTSTPGIRFTIAADSTRTLSANRTINVLDDVFIKNMDKNSLTAQTGIKAGEPAKIILTGSQQKIVSDRGSVSIITADIVDSSGTHVNGANNTIIWKITGPATLVGPAVYESDITRHHQMGGIWYMDMPVSNVIRSTGKPGKIRISVSASGLASGSFDIVAEEKKADNSVIIEPVLANEGRTPVARLTIKGKRLDEVPIEIKLTTDDFNKNVSDKSGYARMIGEYILKNNPAVDSISVEFKTLVEILASHLVNNNGRLTAEDYNFNADHYNNCRLISGYINSTKLPPPFKEGLRKYYSDAIIRQGSEKDTGEEMNWLNWIPSGGTVVVVQNENTDTNVKGVLFTKNTGLPEIISIVYPKFANFSKEAKERAFIFISKMNPYVHVLSFSEQSSESEKGKIVNVTYTAEKEQPILIPLLKFIAE